MKVFMVCPSNSQGLKDYSYSLSNSLNKLDKIDLTILANKNFNKDIKESEIKIDRIFYTKKYKYPYNVFLLIKKIKNSNVDIVHVQTTNLIILGLLFFLRTIFNYKLILTPHSIISHWDRPLYESLQSKIYKNVDGIIWHTLQDKKIMKDKMGIKKNHCAVIPHGNYNIYSSMKLPDSETAMDSLNINKEKYTLLFFGYIREDKRLDLLLNAMAELEDFYKDKIQLIVAGKISSDYKYYKKIINERDLSEIIEEHLGFIAEDKVPLYFKSSDVLVAPYDTISESGVVHIAFSFGKPVIATNVGGFKERIINKKNGLTFDKGDVQALKKKIEYAYDNQDKMREMGRYNNYLANEVYDWDSIALKTYDFYGEVSKNTKN